MSPSPTPAPPKHTDPLSGEPTQEQEQDQETDPQPEDNEPQAEPQPEVIEPERESLKRSRKGILRALSIKLPRLKWGKNKKKASKLLVSK